MDELSLFEKGLIKGRQKNGSFLADAPAKILGDGDLTKKLIFKVSVVSKSAREKIEKTGGKLAAVTSAMADAITEAAEKKPSEE